MRMHGLRLIWLVHKPCEAHGIPKLISKRNVCETSVSSKPRVRIVTAELMPYLATTRIPGVRRMERIDACQTMGRRVAKTRHSVIVRF